MARDLIDQKLAGEFIAIANALKWISLQREEDLLGDDCVGTWVYLYIGKPLPKLIAEKLKVQLKKILPNAILGKPGLYTMTAIIRTLNRANLFDERVMYIGHLKNILQGYFESEAGLEGVSFNEIPLDIIWVLQTLEEIADVSSYQPLISFVEKLKIFKNIDPIRVSMLWTLFNELSSSKMTKVKEIMIGLKGEILSSVLAKEYSDWQVGYLLSFFAKNNINDITPSISKYLLNRQRDCQWDEEGDENIESTSLVAIFIFSYVKEKMRPVLLKNQELLVNVYINQYLINLLESRDDIGERWKIVKNANLDHNKGKLFEEFICFYASQDNEHFKVVESRIRTQTEELDILFENLEANSFFKQLQSRFILVECKNTKKKIEAKEIRNFWTKLQSRKRLLCKIGILISMGKFSKDSKIEMFRLNASSGEILICGIEGSEIEEAISVGNTISKLFEKAILNVLKQ
ncbi:MAG: DUF2034 domain-containing protein, partial [Bacteroidetes bacterium]|nr:DUF2034 domain-containing protein [Bacteroidota bacterium]